MQGFDKSRAFWYIDTFGCESSAWVGVPKRGSGRWGNPLSCVRRIALSAREVESIFAEIVERARASGPTNARTWFDDLRVVHFDGGSIGIACAEEANVRFLEENCKANFTRIAQQITGHLVSVDFLVARGDSPKAIAALPPGPALHPDYT